MPKVLTAANRIQVDQLRGWAARLRTTTPVTQLAENIAQELSDYASELEAAEYRYTGSAINNARQILADCRYPGGELDENGLTREISKVFVELFHEQQRLPKFKDVS